MNIFLKVRYTADSLSTPVKKPLKTAMGNDSVC